jgi:hypothetical protein
VQNSPSTRTETTTVSPEKISFLAEPAKRRPPPLS